MKRGLDKAFSNGAPRGPACQSARHRYLPAARKGCTHRAPSLDHNEILHAHTYVLVLILNLLLRKS